ncbi:uncharacterized protein PFLUO_LOCUS3976 [Penicillium psychrofluorescens]|uniref:uncharacterized protein n=1 Tax=Penicillium psychrofluorescens TaxID=3158075 RepID=UPI003CCDCACC
MNPSTVTFDSLPNEVSLQILSSLSTQSLLPITAVNHRLHALILRILHYRLLAAASLPEYKLLLECFHPSSKLTEPHVFCTYLGTDGLSDRHEGQGSLYESVDSVHRLSRLTGLYSRFRPEAHTDDDVSGGMSRFVSSPRTTLLLPGIVGFMRADTNGDGEERSGTAVTRAVNLEGYEDFSQLCVVVNLVQVMPGTTLLRSAHTIEDGFIRLWREWLKRQGERWKAAARVAEEEGPEAARILRDADETFWVDRNKTVGLKMRVREKEWNSAFPVLMHRDEESTVGYEVDLEELHIRSTRLLLTLEQSQEEQQSYQSNAIIFGAFPSQQTA